MNGSHETVAPSQAPAATDFIVRADFRFGFVDVTDAIRERVELAGLTEGACVAFCRHTTCALLVNEWEDGAQEDFRRRIETLFPPDDYYAHDDLDVRTQNLVPNERRNGHAHVVQMLMGGTSVTLPVRGGDLLLGRWQRVALVELDHPKDRSIALQMLGSYGDDHDPLRTPARRELPRLLG